jgi:hypothetical protein
LNSIYQAYENGSPKSIFPYEYDILEPQLQKPYKNQRRIGWKSFIEGYWGKEW